MIIEDLIKKILKEATGNSTGSRGSYVAPLQPGMRDFDSSKLAPFTDSLSNYKSPLVVYDSYDQNFDLRSGQIRELERVAKKISNFIKKHPESTNSDEDGNVLNRTPSGKENSKKLEIIPVKHQKKKSKINEMTTTTTAGEYSGPQELGMRKWKKSELGAFGIESDNPANKVFKKRTTKKNIYKVVGGWEPQNGKFEVPTYDVDGEYEKVITKGQLLNDPIEWYKPLKNKVKTKKEKKINEDLAVWFGKKKKPKGSSQPKGPWVDICRKVDGKHPPCGRSDASEGSYPKCRAAGVAGKMSDSQKRNACQQKRKAEKNDTQSGKGQKPVMVSHKKKTNESIKNNIITLTESDIRRIVKRILNEETESETLKLPCLKKRHGEHVKSLNKDMMDSDSTWKRKLYFKDGRENSSIYSEINYGYDSLNEKFVRARTTRKFDTIEYYCNSGEVRYFDGKTTLYADRSGNPTVDEQKQKIADTQWLKGFCDLIKFSSCVKTD